VVKTNDKANKEMLNYADSQSLPKTGSKCSDNSAVPDIHSRIKDRMELAHIAESLNDILISSGTISQELIITDEGGCVLYLLKGKSSQNFAIQEGCFINGEECGLNALSMALIEKRAVRLNGKEHSLELFKHCISMGIPILYENQVIGCVGYILPYDTLNKVQYTILDNVIRASLHAANKMLEARKNLDELHLLKRFFSSLDNNQCSMIVNNNFKIIQINRQAEILLGISKDELTGHSLHQIIDDLPANIFNNPKNYFTGEIIMHTSSGNKPFLTNIRPVFSDCQHLVGWHISFAQAVIVSPRDKRVSPRKYEFKDIIGQNREFIKLLGLANAVAKSSSNVLLTGESGTGKELFAQAIHYASYCAEGPFVAINCAAIPKELIETELFGYVEGAFTGARKKGMQGRFLQADEGTIFLDEIGDMPLELQAKLLRVLQERMVTPVGGSKPVAINIRVISATNQNLEQLIAENKFRPDLFYRLNVINLRIPPLRERKDDIPLLVRHFINSMNKKLHKNINGISPKALTCLGSYNWPGNIRELENIIETAVNLADEYIELEHVSFLGGNKTEFNAPADSDTNQAASTLEEVERNEIIRALNQCGGNVGQAAAVLSIGRATLYRKIKKYQISAHVKPE
jgi:transcriptional regulator with PAS, ATPase and Fis domain